MSKLISLEHAYKKLGLIPHEEYIFQQQNQDPSGEFRPLGSTTWMVVSVLVELSAGQNCLLIAPNKAQLDHITQTTVQLGKQLGLRPDFCQSKSAWAIGRAHLYGMVGPSSVVGKVGFKGKAFNDELWKEKAIIIAKGPFARIRRLVQTAEGWYAYDQAGTFLLTLTQQGGEQIIKKFPNIRTIPNWKTAHVTSP